MARYPVVVLGGTFDRLHVGHEALLNTAFRVGRTVGIGLTTADFLGAHSKPLARLIAPYAVRRRTLAAWIGRHHPGRTWWIAPLHDRFGRSVEPGVAAVIVSADTLVGGRAVNRERRRRGLAPVAIVTVPLVLAEDLEPVSSRRIRAGAIDRRGRRTSPIRIRAIAPAPARAAVRGALERVYRSPRIRWSMPGRSRPSFDGRAKSRPASELELDVTCSSPAAGRWAIAVRTAHLRLPAARAVVESERDLEEAIVERLRLRPISKRRPRGGTRRRSR